ncbi:MAG: hypothetical protein HRF48_12160 [Chloroflexota bacterium]
MTQDTSTDSTIPVRWPVDIDLPTLHCNNFAIAKAGDSIYITFGEVRPLFLSGYSPADIEQLRQQGVLIRPLASIAVASDGHKALTQLLVNALEIGDLADLAEHIRRRIQDQQGE